MKIGFIVPRDEVHHVLHVVPVAVELARSQPRWTICLLSSARRTALEVERLLPADLPNIAHLRLKSDDSARSDDGVPYHRPDELMRSFDALVVSEPAGIALRHTFGLKDVPILYFRPGAADHGAHRDRRIKAFDHVLVQGDKLRDRLVEQSAVDADRISVVGCAKFDAPAPMSPWEAPASDGRKIVLYNPHYAPEVSSWYLWGATILDWFVEHDEYRLIFAPHVRLFDRKYVPCRGKLLPVPVGRFEERWLRAPNIHVDLGSAASNNMAYTRHADIYLGDAGAQMYEFIRNPRPCGFLDAHRARLDHKDGRQFNWGAGTVIADVRLFGDMLNTTQEWHPDVYAPVQARMFDYSISIAAEPAAHRAARAIENVVSS